jgi:uncharacterized alpha/beta hydrolase family protein
MRDFVDSFVDYSTQSPSASVYINEYGVAVEKPKLNNLMSVAVDFSEYNDLEHDNFSIRHSAVQYVQLLKKSKLL